MNARQEGEVGTISIKWDSPLDPVGALRFLTTEGLQVRLAAGSPDCWVLDTRSSGGLEAAFAALAALPERGPLTLLIVADAAEETATLARIGLPHGVCRADAAVEQAGPRIARLLRRSSEFRSVPLQREGQTDALTGLPGRSVFNATLDAMLLEATPDFPVSMILMNLDNFRDVNDRYGHLAGDQALCEVAAVIRDGAAGAAALGRISGDGFAVVTHTPLEQAAPLAEFLREQIAGRVMGIRGEAYALTASLGVAVSHGEMSREDLYQMADRCVGAAKVAGRDRVITAEQFEYDAQQLGEDAAIRDFENHVRLVTERLAASLTLRSRRMTGRLQNEADHDGLTGLFVRRYFDRRLARDLENARRHRRCLTLIFLDVDHFGNVNRTYGFPTGDRALRHVAGLLREAVRTVDWVARYGGEEFCVVLPDTAVDEAFDIAERIRVRVGEGTVTAYDGRRLSLTASLGVAELSEEDRSPEDLVQRASDRTRDAKRAGRNTVRR